MNLELLAAEHGTPAYVYSAAGILDNFRAYTDALSGIDHTVCYAVKANSSLAVLSLLARAGAGFDIVSGGELYRVLAAGGRPESVVFSGVGKTEDEIRFALQQKIHSFNCESQHEVELISHLATRSGLTANIAIRVNPDVDVATHPYIATGLHEHKFGLDISSAVELYRRASRLPGIVTTGVSCHIGSQLLNIDPILEAADKILALTAALRAEGFPITDLDLGGGLGVAYEPGDDAVSIPHFADCLKQRLAATDLHLFLEPGRSVVAETGVLLTRVLFTKQSGVKSFVIVDAGINDLIRPSLYGAHHEITPVRLAGSDTRMLVDVVGPVCETGDFFARNREMPTVAPGDLVAIRTVGAYGFVLSSNYNSRPKGCELLVVDSRIHVARRRESFEDLIRGEALLPALESHSP